MAYETALKRMRGAFVRPRQLRRNHTRRRSAKSQRYYVKREPPLRAALRLHDIDHVIVVFDVLEPQVQQFIDADS